MKRAAELGTRHYVPKCGKLANFVTHSHIAEFHSCIVT